jgi:uncharacterized protein (TIGR02118 family)
MGDGLATYRAGARRASRRADDVGSKEERLHMGVKLIVLYPPPKDPAAFEQRYEKEHLPLGARNLAGATRIVSTRIVGAPAGGPAFARMSEVHFPSLEALQACASSPGGQKTIANAVEISTGGAPTFLIAEEAA